MVFGFFFAWFVCFSGTGKRWIRVPELLERCLQQEKPYGGLTDCGVTEEEGRASLPSIILRLSQPHRIYKRMRAHTCKRSKHEP